MFGLAVFVRIVEVLEVMQRAVARNERAANIKKYGDDREAERAQIRRGEIPDRPAVTVTTHMTAGWEVWFKWQRRLRGEQ